MTIFKIRKEDGTIVTVPVSNIEVDSELDLQSENPVSNSVITNRLDQITEQLDDHNGRIQALEANVCLQEGTQILMADGSTKNIEEIQYGDMIMTWDIENNCTIPCKSYGNICTGYETSWKTYCFDNGSVLKIADNHRIYKVDKQMPVLASKWKLGDNGIASNGEQTALYYAPTKLPAALEKKKYTVFSETGLYFANDVLCGHPLAQPLNTNERTRGGIKLSEEDKADLLEYAKVRDEAVLIELKYPEYMKEALPFRQKKEKAEQLIKKYKQNLANRDYKTIKAMQGKLTDVEIAENVDACENLRNKINAKELVVETNDLQIKELQTKHGINIRSFAEVENENIKKAIAKARIKYGVN